jgi:circadian clock protein KaiC
MTDERMERVPTHVPGLDTILNGGLLLGGVYILQGPPGAGKTVLGNQICFRHIKDGQRVVYVTLLAESHARMMQHLRPMSFFDQSPIPSSLYYVSAFRVLEEEGLKGLLTLLRREVRAHGATMLALDGLVAAEESASSAREFKKFIHELQLHANLVNCTTLLLTNGSKKDVHPEHTMVDGLIEMDEHLFGVRAERFLHVKKFRGSNFLRGRHAFRITNDGITVFPRIESLYADGRVDEDDCPSGALSTGIGALDVMTSGGLPRCSSTLLLGPSGSGKSSTAMHFASQATAKEPAVWFGFYESPVRLVQKASSLGLDFSHVTTIWQPATEHSLDALGLKLIDAVCRNGVKRLIVDGIGPMQQSALFPERLGPFFTALCNELRGLGVTSLFTLETRNLMGPEVSAYIPGGLSGLAENVVLLRYLERTSRLHRIVSITKLRDAEFDSSLREFSIGKNGIEIAQSSDTVMSLMGGEVR